MQIWGILEICQSCTDKFINALADNLLVDVDRTFQLPKKLIRIFKWIKYSIPEGFLNWKIAENCLWNFAIYD